MLDKLVLQLIEHETLTRNQVLEIFSPVHKREIRGSYTGYGKRLPSDRPPVLTPKELALTAAAEVNEHSAAGNGQAGGSLGGPGSAGGQQPGGQGTGSAGDSR